MKLRFVAASAALASVLLLTLAAYSGTGFDSTHLYIGLATWSMGGAVGMLIGGRYGRSLKG